MTTDWESKYQSNDTPWDKGLASPGLTDFLESYPALLRGAVCVPGCGYGHDVRAWARAGVRATGYDLAPSAVAGARQRTPTNLAARFLRGDFLVDEPLRQFDWLFEHTCFCAIPISDREKYVQAVEKWVKPGAYYLAVNYFLPPKDEGPPFGVTRDEILRRFTPGFTPVAEWIPRTYPNREGLERMFWWRRKSFIAESASIRI